MVRAATIQGRVALAVSAALADCKLKRDEIAAQMSLYLGEKVTKSVLDAAASQARTEHSINLPRFIALMHVTGDQRLLEMLAEMFGWAVIPRKYLTLIDLAATREREDALRRTRRLLARQAKQDGAL